MFYVLIYDTHPDHAARREPFRAEHLGRARRAHEEGKLFMAGALEPPEPALLVFRTAPDAEAFAHGDPYVLQGVVRGWRVRAWNVVVGPPGPGASPG